MESEVEPTVLPAAFPNLLVNGSSGIAVGMTTNIPPHNMSEVIDGIKLLVANPDVELKELMEAIPGPDFPTAGQIYGKEGILQAYATGRGRIRVRGQADIQDDARRKGREVIILRELPYQVNKAQLIIEIANLVRDKRITGISDIRDESDRDGIRVVVELKRGENANVILNQLFKFTRLQITFGIINLALVNGRPLQMPLKEMLRHFVDFRREVIVRRTAFDLRKAEARAHILEGLKIALDNLDEVIKTIRASKTPKEAKEALRLRFHFSDLQAQAILDMRLHRLTGLERAKIVEEYEALLKLIEKLKSILASESLQLKIVIDELEEIKSLYGDPRRTEIVASEDDITIEDLIDEEEMVITVSHTNYIKRTSLSTYQAQNRGGKGRIGMRTRDEDVVRHLFVASTHDHILIFTSDGRVQWLKVYKIPEVSSDGRGRPVVNLLQMGADVRVAAMLPVSEFTEDRFVVLGTQRGYIKKTPLAAFSRPRAGGIIGLTIEEGDNLFAAGLSSGDDDIFMATAAGKSIHFSENEVRPMGRTARGVIGIRVGEGDKVVEMEVLSGKPDILAVTRNGYGKRTLVDEYRRQNRGGWGLLNIRTSDRNGPVVASMEVDEADQLLLITASGKIIRMNVSGVSRFGRATQGVRLIQTDADDYVVSAIRTAEDEESSADGADENAAEGADTDPDDS